MGCWQDTHGLMAATRAIPGPQRRLAQSPPINNSVSRVYAQLGIEFMNLKIPHLSVLFPPRGIKLLGAAVGGPGLNNAGLPSPKP